MLQSRTEHSSCRSLDFTFAFTHRPLRLMPYSINLPREVQERIVTLCQPGDRHSLRQVRPFRDGALLVLYKECKNIVPLIRLACEDNSAIPPVCCNQFPVSLE